jgi:hypothetical protein
LRAGRDIGRLAEGQLLVLRPAPDLAHDHLTRMDAQAHRQLHPPLLRQAGIELAHGLHHPQPGPHRSLGVIFVREGVAKVDQQAITEVLGDMAFIAGDHLGAGVLIGPHHLAPVLRIELARQNGGIHQVTKQHGELAAFGLRRMRLSSWLGLLGLGDSRWGFWQCASVSRPHEHGARLVDRNLMHLNELRLERVQRLVIEVELHPQRPIGHPPAAPEHLDHLVDHCEQVH